ncbi:MAG: hypothetical protein ABL973_11730 [Micropepsaceae bacterium]
MSGWRIFFIVAALFNFAAGVPFLIAPHEALALMNLPPATDVLFHQATGALVIAFGVGYGIVAGNLSSNHAIVWLGTGGKAGVVALFAQAYLSGAIPFQAFAVAIGDVLFLIGFAAFLITNRAEA